MVEQIDRDAGYQPFNAIYGQRVADKMLAGDMDGHHLLCAFAAHRQAAEARMIARMREPDAKMVEAVARGIYDATHKGLSNCYSWDDAWEQHQEHRRKGYLRDATAALSAAADAMERTAAMDELIAMSAEELETNNG